MDRRGRYKTLLARAVAGEAGVTVLLSEWLRVHSDVRGRRCKPRARSISNSERERTGDHLR